MKIGMASPGSQISEDSNSSVEGEIISTAVKQGRSLRESWLTDPGRKPRAEAAAIAKQGIRMHKLAFEPVLILYKLI